MSEILPAIEIGPGPDRPARGAVIWLHGLGASGHDFEDVVRLLELPDPQLVDWLLQGGRPADAAIADLVDDILQPRD